MKKIIVLSMLMLLAVFAAPAKASGDAPSESLRPSSGVEAVDLGLTSGTLWANMNVGAENAWDVGAYFMWGHTEDCRNKGLLECETLGVDFGNVLFAGNIKYDAATANWGEEWVTPSHWQIDELIHECNWIWIESGDYRPNGFLVVSESNGNSIFIPSGGKFLDAKFMYGGSYWSSTSTLMSEQLAYQLLFSDGGAARADMNRAVAMPVRAVLASSGEGDGQDEELKAVDLGLPSGTKWANMNVGARNMVDYGSYIVWGQTYDARGIRLQELDTRSGDKGIGDWSGDVVYDAATAIMGSAWATPTAAQMKELLVRCCWTIGTMEYGRCRESMPGYFGVGSNGKYIFLPFLYGSWPLMGFYWTSTPVGGGELREAKSCVLQRESLDLENLGLGTAIAAVRAVLRVGN